MLILIIVLLLFLLVVAGIIVTAVWYKRKGPGLNVGGPPTPPAQREADPLTLLRESYARGEMSRQEYDARRRDLESESRRIET
ncbi:MAG TPA: SHOCT domain-containing protein [Anaerolineae bacterium]|nr:SHOCT domain-containing protein [Anaerolineae bacterium]